MFSSLSPETRYAPWRLVPPLGLELGGIPKQNFLCLHPENSVDQSALAPVARVFPREKQVFCFFLLLSFLYIGRAGLSVTSSTGALHPSLVSQHGCRDASSCRRAPDWLACRAERDAGGVTRQSQSAAVQGGPAAQTRGGRTECTWLE